MSEVDELKARIDKLEAELAKLKAVVAELSKDVDGTAWQIQRGPWRG